MLRVAPKQPPTGPVLALAGSVAILAAVGLAFYWLPSDVDQGFSQRIFYLHVPVALTTYACFVFAGWKDVGDVRPQALLYPWV